MSTSPISEFTFNPSSFSSKICRLTLDEEFICLNEKKLKASEITSIKYGIKPMEFDMFNTGSIYQIDLKDIHGSQLNVRFRSYFFRKQKLYTALFEEIATVLWEKIATKLVKDKLLLLENNQSFSVGNCMVKPEGIIINNQHLIGWHECLMQRNYDRLVINSKKNQSHYTTLFYADTWDVFILMELAEQMLNPSELKKHS